MKANTLPFGKQVAYACGMMGWSMMINLIGVILVYLYLPPENSGLPKLISQAAILGVFNIIALISASGRLVDALIDPLIAQRSDRSTNPKGRRIPMMKLAILPSVIFCILIFYPLSLQESSGNIFWLVFTLIGFYISSTTYIIPYNALLPELAHSSADKVRFSTFQSVGYVMGIAISSNVFNLSDLLQEQFHLGARISSIQLGVLVMAVLAGLFMLVTVLAIDEKKYTVSVPSAVPLRPAIMQTLRNRNFLLFIVADFSYFMAVTIITSGLMYFVTVLLPLHESIGNKLMITMVMVSFIFYPLNNYLAARTGKKPIMLVSFFLLALVFLGVFYLGKNDFSPLTQIYTLIIFAAIPLASLNILPNAILAEVIEKDSKDTGENKEAIYYAVRYFFIKIAQTLSIALFATFLRFGKDVGNDLGIRLNGAAGFILCCLAALIFSRFKERREKTSEK